MECKTLRHREENDNDLTYKVDSLGQDARGLFGETWLLTAREPSDVLRERARQGRITLLGPTELPRLRERVRMWMRMDCGNPTSASRRCG
jgi:Card1-like, endonuclease domain